MRGGDVEAGAGIGHPSDQHWVKSFAKRNEPPLLSQLLSGTILIPAPVRKQPVEHPITHGTSRAAWCHGDDSSHRLVYWHNFPCELFQRIIPRADFPKSGLFTTSQVSHVNKYVGNESSSHQQLDVNNTVNLSLVW